jgi:hypothetical protein
MSTYKGQSSYGFDPPPYPKWWDYFNGAIVIAIALAAAIAVLGWMIGISLSTI